MPAVRIAAPEVRFVSWSLYTETVGMGPAPATSGTKVVNTEVGACFLQKPLLPTGKGSPATEAPVGHQLGGGMDAV